MENMEKINKEALDEVTGGGLKDALAYLEELKNKYGLPSVDDVKKIWTAEEQGIFDNLLKKLM